MDVEGEERLIFMLNIIIELFVYQKFYFSLLYLIGLIVLVFVCLFILFYINSKYCDLYMFWLRGIVIGYNSELEDFIFSYFILDMILKG